MTRFVLWDALQVLRVVAAGQAAGMLPKETLALLGFLPQRRRYRARQDEFLPHSLYLPVFKRMS